MTCFLFVCFVLHENVYSLMTQIFFSDLSISINIITTILILNARSHSYSSTITFEELIKHCSVELHEDTQGLAGLPYVNNKIFLTWCD